MRGIMGCCCGTMYLVIVLFGTAPEHAGKVSPLANTADLQTSRDESGTVKMSL